MPEITNIIHQLSFYLPQANITFFIEIILATYCISGGGVTHKNISRWTGEGASYRSIQRFFAEPISWHLLNLHLFRLFRFDPSAVYLLCFDEVVEGKSGKSTHKVGRFFSSLFGKPINSISALAYSIIDVARQKSFMVNAELLDQQQSAKAAKVKPNKGSTTGQKKKKRKGSKNKSKKQKRVANSNKNAKKKRGRPKNSKNKPKVLGSHFQVMARCIQTFKQHLQEVGLVNFPLSYVVGDGYYGNRSGCVVCREAGLHLISKLQKNAALYEPYNGPQKNRGRKRKYGAKINYQNLAHRYLIHCQEVEGQPNLIEKCYYFKAWNKRIPYLLGCVVVQIHNLKEQTFTQYILFSTDTELSAELIKHYYHLRFQIEFNFRDAKQYFGLSDFKNIKPIQVNNAIGFSFFMVNFTQVLSTRYKKLLQVENLSILDLKAYFRAEKYLKTIINYAGIDHPDIFNEDLKDRITRLGAINR